MSQGISCWPVCVWTHLSWIADPQICRILQTSNLQHINGQIVIGRKIHHEKSDRAKTAAVVAGEFIIIYGAASDRRRKPVRRVGTRDIRSILFLPKCSLWGCIIIYMHTQTVSAPLVLLFDRLSVRCVEIGSGLWCIIVVSANQITAAHERNPLGSPKETADFSFSTFLWAAYPHKC